MRVPGRGVWLFAAGATLLLAACHSSQNAGEVPASSPQTFVGLAPATSTGVKAQVCKLVAEGLDATAIIAALQAQGFSPSAVSETEIIYDSAHCPTEPPTTVTLPPTTASTATPGLSAAQLASSDKNMICAMVTAGTADSVVVNEIQVVSPEVTAALAEQAIALDRPACATWPADMANAAGG